MMATDTEITVRRIADPDQWDRVVQHFPRYDFRQGFAWGEFRVAQGWRPARFAALRDGEPVAACAVLSREVPGLGAVLYAPRGPLFDPEAPVAIAALLASIRAFARRYGAAFLRLSPAIPDDDLESTRALAGSDTVTIHEPWTTWNTPRYVQVLDLRRAETDLLREVRRRTREYIVAAPRRGIVIEASEREEDLIAFHALMVNVGRIKRFPVRDLGWYRALLRHYRPDGGATLLIARIEQAVVGGLLTVRYGRRASLLYTSVRGQVPDSVRHHLAPAMAWEFVRHARKAGCEVADFGGSGVEIPPKQTDPGWGVYHFKAGMGCRLDTFVPFHDIVFRPARYRVFRLTEARLLPRLWTLVARAPQRWPARVLGAGA